MRPRMTERRGWKRSIIAFDLTLLVLLLENKGRCLLDAYIEWSNDHGTYANQCEETYDHRGVLIWWFRKQESQGCPVIGEDSASHKAHNTSLCQNRISRDHTNNTP